MDFLSTIIQSCSPYMSRSEIDVWIGFIKRLRSVLSLYGHSFENHKTPISYEYVMYEMNHMYHFVCQHPEIPVEEIYAAKNLQVRSPEKFSRYMVQPCLLPKSS